MFARIMPTTYFLAFLMLSILSYFVIPVIKFIHPPWNYIGVVLIVFGIIINLWTDQIFKQNDTTVKPGLMPTALVTSGPFRMSRHPMYLGMAAVLLGTAILQGCITGFIFPVIFIIAMEIIFIRSEENNLFKAFEQQYIDYKKKVRRWI